MGVAAYAGKSEYFHDQFRKSWRMARKKSKASVSRSIVSPPKSANQLALPTGYAELLADLKDRIRAAQLRAGFAVNQELLLLYYEIGLNLHRKTEQAMWGSSVIERLADDLRREFSEMSGFSPRNLRRLRAFYEAYPLDSEKEEIWPQAVAKIELVSWPPPVAKLPWAHNVILLEKCKNADVRVWYAAAALEHGWSRNVLALQIDSRLHQRRGKAITNFQRTLPAPQSDLVRQLLFPTSLRSLLGGRTRESNESDTDCEVSAQEAIVDWNRVNHSTRVKFGERFLAAVRV